MGRMQTVHLNRCEVQGMQGLRENRCSEDSVAPRNRKICDVCLLQVLMRQHVTVAVVFIIPHAPSGPIAAVMGCISTIQILSLFSTLG